VRLVVGTVLQDRQIASCAADFAGLLVMPIGWQDGRVIGSVLIVWASADRARIAHRQVVAADTADFFR
jgi:hypothetical protein